MNSKRILLLLTVVMQSFALQAQTIEGKLVDENRQPLPYANIVLLSLPDSAFVAGITSNEEGVFQLQANPKGKLLRISMIGYETLYIANTSHAMGVIQLTPDTQLLGEVVIKGDLPKTQLKGDAMVTNVQNSLLAKAGSANDVLGKIPGILRKDDAFEVFGKGTPIIYINGRLVRDQSELEQLNAEDIKQVEVVQNPGARYDATVKAVIRIETVRRQGEGFGFNLRLSYDQSENIDLTDQLDLNYRYNGLDLFATLMFQQDEEFQKADMQQTLHTKQPLVLDQQVYWGRTSRILRPTLGLNYQFNEQHSAGVRYRPIKQLTDKANDEGYSIVNIDGKVDDRIHTLSQGNTDYDVNHQLNTYYKGNIGQLNIDFNADLLHNGSKQETYYDEQSELAENRMVHTYNAVKNRLGAAKLILTHPLLGGSLSVGSEYTYTYRNDDYLNEENYIPTSYSKIKEHNANAFAEYSHSLPFGSVSAGIRYEHVDFNYYEEGVYQADQSRMYDNYYPNASLSAKLGPVQAQLSYTAKTTRPAYFKLGNSIIYIDRYSFAKGNPTLRPELNHDLSLVTSWKFLQFSASYMVTKDAMVQRGVCQEGNEEAILLYHDNLPENIPQLTALLSAAPRIQRWSPSLSIGVKKQWLTTDYIGQPIKMNTPVCFIVFNNSLELPKDFLISLDFNWNSRGDIQIYTLQKTQHKLNLSIRKSFLKETLSVELKGVNLTDGYDDKVSMYNGDYSIVQDNSRDNQEFILTLRYKFNTAKSKYKGTGAGTATKNRM